MRPFTLILPLFILLFCCTVHVGYGQCDASFTQSATSICQGGSINFVVNSFSANFEWFVDGTSQGTGGNKTIPFTVSGTFKVKVIGTNFNGTCTDSINITVHPKPSANFTFNNDNQCAPMLTNFTNSTTGGTAPYSAIWEDNLAQFSTQNNSQRTFGDISSNSVIHDIKLTLQDANGCTDNITKQITVIGRPDATLTDDDTNDEWKECASASSVTLSVSNGSNTMNNSNYSITWGGTATDYNSTSPPINYTNNYNNFLGYDTITYTITNSNNCTSTKEYYFFNGSNPSGGVASPGNTINFCAPLTVDFPINNTAQNTPGTIYIFSFDDGSPNDTILHPVPSIYSHTFTESSCNNTTIFNSPNAFSIRMRAENPCFYSNSSVDPVIVSSLTSPDFTYPDNVCVNTPITFNSTAETAYIVSSGSCDSTTYKTWEVTPMNGVTILSPNLNGNNLQARFSIEGTYTIALTDSNSCGANTVYHSICIIPEPIASYNIGSNNNNDTIGCFPFTINTINNTSNITSSCAEIYNWSVNSISSNCSNPNTTAWSFINNTSASSKNPQITFNEPGEYELVLFINNECTVNSSFSRRIIVQAKPQFTLASIPDVCKLADFNPTITNFNSCYDGNITWTWTATTNGIVEFPNQQDPGVVNFTTSGTKNIQVSAQNACGTTTDDETVNVNILPTPPTLTGNAPCENETVTITSTGGTANTNLSWDYPDNGSATSSTITRPNATQQMEGDYLLTVTDPTTNCSDTVSVFIPVHELPTITITADNSTPCVGENINLTPSGANSYTWQLAGGNSTDNPLSIHPTQDTTYAVIGVDGNGCENSSSIFIDTKPRPIVNAGSDTVACFQIPAIPMQLTGTQDTGNDNDGVWASIGNIAPNTISATGVFTPNAVASDMLLTYTYTNSTTQCTTVDTVEMDVITPQIADAGNDTTVCQGSAIITLAGNSSDGVWRQLPSNTIVTTFNPDADGTYQFSYTIGAGSCISQDMLQITVNPLPTVTIQNDFSICANEAEIDLTENISGGTWAGTGITNTATGLFDPSAVNSPTTNLTYTYTDANTCTNSDALTITIDAVTEANAGNDIEYCNIPDDITLTGFSPNSGTWSDDNMTVTGSGVFNSNGISNTYELYYSFTNANTCTDIDTMIVTVEDLVKPIIQNDTAVCEDTPMLHFISTPIGGNWRLDGAVADSTFTPNQPNVYKMIYFIEENTTCVSSDTLEITVQGLPQITLSADTTLCADAPNLNLLEIPSGGIWTGTGVNATSGIFDVAQGSQTLTYTYTADYTIYNNTFQCTNNDVVNITVNDLPTVSVQDSVIYCLSNQPITLPTGTPSAGNWSGMGITAPNQFDPTGAGGIGTYSGIYTYTDVSTTCTNTDNMVIVVENAVAIDAGVTDTICITDAPITLSGFLPTGGEWTGSGVSIDGTFNPQQAGDGLKP